MKKIIVFMIAAVLAVGSLGAFGCGGEKNILVISREASSGTREAFSDIVAKDGVKLKDVELVKNSDSADSTGVVLSKVASNKTAIGYISLSSLSEDVKALKINGVAATAANVQNGTYKIWRPFLLLTPAASTATLSAAAQDFFNFCMSKSAEQFILDEGCILTGETLPEYSTAQNTVSGSITISGSTSMKELMIQLIGAYQKVQSGVSITPSYTGSGDGRTAVKNDANGNTIGLASSSKADDAYVQNTICKDAVAVIVNKSCALDDVTLEQIFDIYTGAIAKYSEITQAA